MKSDRAVVGRRFGRLTAMKRVGRDRQGKRVWELLCDCGGITRRRLENVYLSVFRGKTPMCIACAQRAAIDGSRLVYARRRWRKLWAHRQQLWSRAALWFLERDVRRRVGVELGFEPDDAPFDRVGRALDSDLWPNGAAIFLERR